MPLCIYSYPFIENDAFHEMSAIVEAARGRAKITGQTERHHIIPRSLDPTLVKEPSNLVHLTFQEHYQVHMLLPECIVVGKDRDKMIQAKWRMACRKDCPISHEQYAQLRQQNANIASRYMKYRWATKTWNIDGLKRYWRDPNQAEARSCRLRGIPKSAGHIENMRRVNSTPEAKQRQSKRIKSWMSQPGFVHPLKGKPKSEKTRQLLSLALKGKPKPIGRKLSTLHKSRIAASHSKQWIVTNPQNESFLITNLHSFCQMNQLNTSHMSAVAHGGRKTHKGWTCQHKSQ